MLLKMQKQKKVLYFSFICFGVPVFFRNFVDEHAKMHVI